MAREIAKKAPVEDSMKQFLKKLQQRSSMFSFFINGVSPENNRVGDRFREILERALPVDNRPVKYGM